MLSLPFLYPIWFTPTNFTVILKPLNNFFKKLDNPEINHQLTYPQGFKDIENKEGNGASNVTKFFPSDFVFSSERPHYSLALFSSFIFTCTTCGKKKTNLQSKGPFNYFPVILRSFRTNENKVNDNMYCRTETKCKIYCIAIYFCVPHDEKVTLQTLYSPFLLH